MVIPVQVSLIERHATSVLESIHYVWAVWKILAMFSITWQIGFRYLFEFLSLISFFFCLHMNVHSKLHFSICETFEIINVSARRVF